MSLILLFPGSKVTTCPRHPGFRRKISIRLGVEDIVVRRKTSVQNPIRKSIGPKKKSTLKEVGKKRTKHTIKFLYRCIRNYDWGSSSSRIKGRKTHVQPNYSSYTVFTDTYCTVFFVTSQKEQEGKSSERDRLRFTVQQSCELVGIPR